jgi:hypothetical protein
MNSCRNTCCVPAASKLRNRAARFLTDEHSACSDCLGCWFRLQSLTLTLDTEQVRRECRQCKHSDSVANQVASNRILTVVPQVRGLLLPWKNCHQQNCLRRNEPVLNVSPSLLVELFFVLQADNEWWRVWKRIAQGPSPLHPAARHAIRGPECSNSHCLWITC